MLPTTDHVLQMHINTNGNVINAVKTTLTISYIHTVLVHLPICSGGSRHGWCRRLPLHWPKTGEGHGL